MRKLTEYALKLEEWEKLGRDTGAPKPEYIKPKEKPEVEIVKEEGRF